MRTVTTTATKLLKDGTNQAVSKDSYQPEEVALLIGKTVRTVYDRARLLQKTMPYVFDRPPRSSGEFTKDQVSLIKQVDELIKQKRKKNTEKLLLEKGLLP